MFERSNTCNQHKLDDDEDPAAGHSVPRESKRLALQEPYKNWVCSTTQTSTNVNEAYQNTSRSLVHTARLLQLVDAFLTNQQRTQQSQNPCGRRLFAPLDPTAA